MSNEITPMQAVQDKIKTRIQDEFVSLIPDEMFANMVASVIKDFTTDKPATYHGHSPTPSPLKQMIKAEIETKAKEAILKELAKLDDGHWNSYGQRVAGDAIKKFIAENFNEMLRSIQGQMVDMSVMMALQKMREGIRY